MNAERLLALYEKVGEAPDAIARLRRFVLDLAVRGKLVEQAPNDEPASELLKRIAVEKARLVKTGTARRENTDPTASPEQHAFPLPSSWAWVPATFPAYGVSDLGKKVQTKEVLPSGAFPVVDQGKVVIRGYCDDQEKVIRVAAPMIVFGDHTREIKLINFDFIVGADGVKLLQPVCVDASYYFLALQWLPLDSRGYGRHFKLLKASALPLPPLAEQGRIVAKVEELMALLDRLEAARAAREVTRDRLTAASLARLTAPDTTLEVFPAHARFALDVLPALTSRTDQIKSLRQTILNLAVRGQLVEQDPRDKPASELLRRLVVEKGRMVKAGEISTMKPLPRITRDQLAFTIPPHWEPLKLCEMLDEIQTGPFGSSLHQSDYVLGGTPVINPASLQNDGIVPIEKMAVGPRTLERLSSFTLCIGDIVMARRGEMGRCALVTEAEAGWLCGTGSLILRPSKLLYAPFLVLMIGSPFSREYLGGTAVGTTMQNLNQSILLNLSVGLPPLAEQRRIVAKVEELMALCDRLEASLATADTTKQRLLKTLLHKALEPTLKEAA